MRDPFSSDYLSNTATKIEAPISNHLETKPNVVEALTTASPLNEAAARALGFEPERYGLGKPRRIVIRGKITHGKR